MSDARTHPVGVVQPPGPMGLPFGDNEKYIKSPYDPDPYGDDPYSGL